MSAAELTSKCSASFEEAPTAAILQLCFTSKSKKEVEGKIGVSLPDPSSATSASGNGTILNSGPDRYWLVLDEPNDDLIGGLAKLDGVYTLDITEARKRFRLSGPNVRDVLQKGLAVDLHPSVSSAGRIISSAIAKVQVTVHVIENSKDNDQAFDLYVSPAFAHNVVEWVETASAEY